MKQQWILTSLLFATFATNGCSQKAASDRDQSVGATVVPSEATPAESPAKRPGFYTVDHYDNNRDPAADLANTVTRAKAENKRILIQVGGDWCGWCKLMSNYIETNDKVRETIERNFVVMKVTENNDHKNAAFLDQYPSIPGYPHLFVLDAEGKLLHSQGTAELEEGHGYNDAKYLEFLDKWKLTE